MYNGNGNGLMIIGKRSGKTKDAEIVEMQFLEELQEAMTIPMEKRDIKRLEFLTKKYKEEIHPVCICIECDPIANNENVRCIYAEKINKQL